jgi:ankyrin repeat protein
MLTMLFPSIAALDANSQNIKGRTSLHIAAQWSPLVILINLLEHSTIDITAVDKKGQNALHYSAQWDRFENARHLLADSRIDPFATQTMERLGRRTVVFSKRIRHCQQL